jgi:hypothetical protein
MIQSSAKVSLTCQNELFTGFDTAILANIAADNLITHLRGYASISSYWDAFLICKKVSNLYLQDKPPDYLFAYMKTLLSHILSSDPTTELFTSSVQHLECAIFLPNNEEMNFPNMLLRLYVDIAQKNNVPRFVSLAIYKFYVRGKDELVDTALMFWPGVSDPYLQTYLKI